MRNWIADAFLGPGHTPLYEACIAGARMMSALAGTGRGILVVITDGEDSVSPGRRGEAATALRSSGAWNYLVFASEPATPTPGTPSADDSAEESFRQFAQESGSAFRLALPGAADELARRVLEQACRNHAPSVGFRIDPPSPLRLGNPGFDVRLDASQSSDDHTARADLDFRWSVTRSGRPERTRTAAGNDGAIFSLRFTDDDIGTWNVSLEVSDRDGGRHVATAPLEVVGAPPQIDLQSVGTINALEELAVRTDILEDIDGGALTFSWELLYGPPNGSFAVGTTWETPEVRWTTTEADITSSSDAQITIHPVWQFQLTVRDDDGSAPATERVRVRVKNLPPSAEIEGPTRVAVGDSVILRSRDTADPDGGNTARRWDIVQAPDLNGASRAALSVGDQSQRALVTTDRDAGTWIYRLTVEDNEGESDARELKLLVDAPPHAVIAPASPEPMDSVTASLTLDGMMSVDPDTPCPAPHTCTDRRCCGHTNLEEPVVVSPGIGRWTWTLVDVPIEWLTAYPLGGVDEVLGIPARHAFNDGRGIRQIPCARPVGYRVAAAHPERISAIVVQNGNAYDEGLDNDFWKPIKEYWKDPDSKEKREALRDLLTYKATKWQYTTGAKNPELVSPDGAAEDQFLLDRPGNAKSSSTCSSATAATRRSIPSGRSTSARTSRRC